MSQVKSVHLSVNCWKHHNGHSKLVGIEECFNCEYYERPIKDSNTVVSIICSHGG